MRIYCEKCNEDITKKVDRQFEQFLVGRIQCDHCQKMSSRYISESDILLYLGFSELLYLALSVITSVAFFYLGISIVMALIFICLLVLGYNLQKTFSRTIWLKAPLKTDYANVAFKEDQLQIAKSTNWQFIMYFALVITAITGTTFQLFFFFVAVFAIFITFVKFFLCIKGERNQL